MESRFPVALSRRRLQDIFTFLDSPETKKESSEPPQVDLFPGGPFPRLGEDAVDPGEKRRETQDVLRIMRKNGGHELLLSRGEIVEVNPGHLGSRHVHRPFYSEHTILQEPERGSPVYPSPEPTEGIEDVEMEVWRDGMKAAHHAARFKEGKVEAAAIVAHEGRRSSEGLEEDGYESGLSGVIGQKKLRNAELASLDTPDRREKGDGSRPAGETGGLEIEESKRLGRKGPGILGRIDDPRSGVAAEERTWIDD